MKIRKSEQQDLDRIMEIYDFARDFMAKHGNQTNGDLQTGQQEN